MLFITAVLLSATRLSRGARLLCIGISLVLASCGGGKDDSKIDPETGLRITPSMVPASKAEAQRFLTQATFGPTPEDIARVTQIGYDNWIDEQFRMPLGNTYLALADASVAQRKISGSDGYDILNSWWTNAVRDPAQLRQRVAFALSEIFVVSSLSVGNGRTVASYMDTLYQGTNGTYRELIEAVAMHPAMGQYLSHLSNRKEDPASGRVPDENFARELLQLFSIGLYELDDQGRTTPVGQAPVETYTPNDIKGMARVFTGFSWSWPSTVSVKAASEWYRCFWRFTECRDASQEVAPMRAYAEEHEPGAKTILKTITIEAKQAGQADPKLSLKQALDGLARHHNVAPFISKQLIQRLVTSNPSPAYVGDVVAVFRATNGNLREVVKAILLHDEARHPERYPANTYGKLREPVLKWAHVLRTVPHNSAFYGAGAAAGTVPVYLTTDTDSGSSALGQSPLRAPSVFNFFRPGYRPAQTRIGDQMLVSPEMQITNETSVLSYANFVAQALNSGWGQWNAAVNKVDIQFDTTMWDGVVAKPDQLIDAVSTRLTGSPLPSDVRSQAITALESIAAADAAGKRRRTLAAILLTTVSPGFTAQQ
jgi:uncharacterized protein (DUF1800 family)